MDSASDEPIVQGTMDTLDQLQVDYEVRVMSAHRNPEKVRDYALTARERGIEVFISAAGGSAALGASWRHGVQSQILGYRWHQAI